MKKVTLTPISVFFAARKQPHHRGKAEVDRACRLHRTREAEAVDHDEAARQDARGGAQAVGEIEHRKRLARRGRIAPDEPGAHQGESRSEQDRLRQDQGAGERPFGKGSQRFIAQRGKQLGIGGVGRRDEDRVKHDRGESDQRFGDRVSGEQVLPASRVAAAQPGADRHAAHEQGEHQRLRIGRVAEKELEIVAPDRLVDEPGESGDGEQREIGAAGDAGGGHAHEGWRH
ncbi:MAG: hypothetical protein HYU75_24380 [Betaproteobacteria bacterium]|nr:hypothetical protein [Betaproteobacteria bacterium]